MTQSDTFSKNNSCQFLIIGYGHQNHGDDGIGSQIVSMIQDLALDQVTTHIDEELHPELAGKIAAANYVIFVHACRMKEPSEIRVQPLDACGSETTGSVVPCSGHGCDPCSLLALTRSVHGHCPEAWWIAIQAEDFTVNHSLSKTAQHALKKAQKAIEDIVLEKTGQLSNI